MNVNIQSLLSSAFHGVSLGNGVSLRQAQAIDGFSNEMSDLEFESLPINEITNDWQRVSLAELELNCVAHLDPEGYRYYIPAFLVSVLNHYKPSSMRVIGTLSSLYPKESSWFYHMEQYSLLNQEQREAIATYISLLPNLVDLDSEYLTIVERALKVFWYKYINSEIHIWQK